MNLRHMVEIQRKKVVPGPLGSNVEWETVERRRCAFTNVNTEGRAQFMQIGHSSVAGRLVFRGPIDIEMGEHRFVYQGEFYEAIEPPANLDTINRFVSVAVRRLVQQPEPEEPEEPEEPGGNGGGGGDDDDDVPGPL